MEISEIFYSIQGEGKLSGLPTIFIRTVGCNLRCSYCDTTYAYSNGKEMSVKDIINAIAQYPCSNVCITGGEPLIHEKIFSLIDFILDKGYLVSIETNGSKSIEKLVKKDFLMVSLDIKCPSSGMKDKMQLRNIDMLRKEDQLKFVIKNKEDYEFVKKLIKKHNPVSPIFLQPVGGTKGKKLSNWMLKDGLNARLGLQIQKIIDIK